MRLPFRRFLFVGGIVGSAVVGSVLATTTLGGAAAESVPSNITSNPSGSEEGSVTLSSLWELFDCDQDRPLHIHTDQEWKLIQSIYEEIVGNEASSLPAGGYLGIHGFYTPVEVRMGDHGRGIYAVTEIEEGTMVWRSFLTARFESGTDYQRFLHALPPPLACDVLMWAYTRLEQQTPTTPTTSVDHPPNDIRVVACVDLDPGSFVNGCDVDQECNLELWQPQSPRTTGCRLEFYAARDIEAGEELRIDYSFSERESGWAELGLTSSNAPSLLTLMKRRNTLLHGGDSKVGKEEDGQRHEEL